MPQILGKTLGTIAISIGVAHFQTHGSTVDDLPLAADNDFAQVFVI